MTNWITTDAKIEQWTMDGFNIYFKIYIREKQKNRLFFLLLNYGKLS
jgi:hypothetical protein